MASSTPSAGPRSGWSARLAVPISALLLFAALAGYLRWVQAGVAGTLAAAPAPGVEVARVQRTVRAMDLVAIRLDTVVTARSGDQSWRGDVDAQVHAPACLYYGTDLSAARVESVDLGPMLRGVRVVVPEPRRIATEVFSDQEVPEVRVGWLRLRSQAGEYHLGQARKGLSDAARHLTLGPEDQEMVRTQTRERIAELVGSIAGEGVRVRVDFAGEPGTLDREQP